MTFQEYINQTDIKRASGVIVTDNDIYHKWKQGKDTVINLFMLGEHWLYLLPHDSYGNLWTMDEHGNKKSMSCFIYKV